MENTASIRFPWVKLIIAVVVEIGIGLAINFSRGEFPFESIGGLFPFLALLTIVLFAFIHARKISSRRLQLFSGLLFLAILSILSLGLNF